MASFPSDRRVPIVVVGCGRMGLIRCEHISAAPDCELVGVVDADIGAAALLCARYAGCGGAASVEEMIDDVGGKVALWICAPTDQHAALIQAAAARGRPVAVEKPVALTIADIDACYRACEAGGASLYCAFQRRTDAAYCALRSRVAAGALGHPRSIRCVFRDHPAVPEAFLLGGGGDVYHDLATHDIDFALQIAKDAFGGGPLDHAPDEVYAVGSSSTPALADAGVHDAATVVVTWRRDGGLVATFDLSRSSAYGYDQRCEVFGSNGCCGSVENPAAAPLRIMDAAGAHDTPLVHSFPERFRDAFREDVAVFADCCRGAAAPPATRTDAILATLVAEAALQSSRLRRAVTISNPSSSTDAKDLVLDV